MTTQAIKCGFTCKCRIPCDRFAVAWDRAFKKQLEEAGPTNLQNWQPSTAVKEGIAIKNRVD